MEWSWTTWLVSVAAVVVSGAAAWLEGCWARRSGLDMGFANHGGMWGDLLLLPIANAVMVPQLSTGPWIAGAVLIAAIASALVHHHWYRGAGKAAPPDLLHSCDHMWPCRPHGSWSRDLSIAGWLHVLYVVGELSILIGFLIHPMPDAVVLVVAAVFTIHVPIGLLQPRWFLSGRIASFRQQPLLLPSLLALWAVAAVKL